MSDLQNLTPSALWRYFDTICDIPHCSKHEEKLAAFIANEGKKHGCEVRRDSTGNIVLAVPASPGKEGAPTTILQGHIDMVCEKRAGLDFDFGAQAIVPRIDGEWVYATETTLGADNGIGVAAALAMLEDDSVVHGPLELLFTIDEETGLTGALGLDPALISGKLLINMDSEEDGMLYVGCAGGQHLETRLPLEFTATPGGTVGAAISVSGLKGGHSGCDIHENRGNAVKLLARVLKDLQNEWGDTVQLGDVQAGTTHNAIPRDGELTLAATQAQFDALAARCDFLTGRFKKEFANEEKLLVSVKSCPAPARVLRADNLGRLVNMLLGFHNGVFAMSRDMPTLVETSNSLAVCKFQGDSAFVLNSTRSSSGIALASLLTQNEAIAKLAGATSEWMDGYPGWQPNMDSPLLKLLTGLFEARYNKTPEITAIHAGLECGLIGERFSDMDMISFGPEIQNPHSPDERVWIPSVERFWTLLADTLAAIAEQKL